MMKKTRTEDRMLRHVFAAIVLTLLLFTYSGVPAQTKPAILAQRAKPPSVPRDGIGGGGDRTGPGSPCDPEDGAAAINAKAAELSRFGVQLGTPGQIMTARDGVGKFRRYSAGYNIFWSPATCARLIYGGIYAKWESIGRERSPFGYPISDEMDMYDGRGRYSKFQNGFIVWAANTGAHLLSGAIGQKWWELVERGRVGGFFPGYPTTDEDGTPGVVRWNHFEDGSIYWLPYTGAHETHGAIRNLWLNQLRPSGPNSWLGSPRTDEKMMPDGQTPYQRFENGIITYDGNQRKFVAVANPSENPYFAAARVDLLFKQNLDIGKPIPRIPLLLAGG